MTKTIRSTSSQSRYYFKPEAPDEGQGRCANKKGKLPDGIEKVRSLLYNRKKKKIEFSTTIGNKGVRRRGTLLRRGEGGEHPGGPCSFKNNEQTNRLVATSTRQHRVGLFTTRKGRKRSIGVWRQGVTTKKTHGLQINKRQWSEGQPLR